MVKHIILWTLKEELSGEQKETIKQGIKEGLEGLSGQIPGLLEISVRTDCLPSSTVDVMLDSTFESAKALKNYSTHPKHVAVADGKVRPYTATRACMDFEVQKGMSRQRRIKKLGTSVCRLTARPESHCRILKEKITVC